MEPGQAGRRWNKKHFCSSPFPSPGRPSRQPCRASPSRAPAQSLTAPGPRPTVQSSARLAIAAAAIRLRPVARRAGPEVRRGPPAGPGRGEGGLTPPRMVPSVGQIPESPSENSPCSQPQVIRTAAAPQPPARLPCPLLHLRLGGGWTARRLGIRKLPGPVAELVCSPVFIHVKCAEGSCPASLTQKGSHVPPGGWRDPGERVYLKCF